MDPEGDLAVHPIFHDAVLKKHWARYKIEQMRDLIHRYNEDSINTSIVDLEDEGRFFEFQGEKVSFPFNLHVGDIVRNLRGSLDHAVSAIYRAHNLKDDSFDVHWHTGDNRKTLENSVKSLKGELGGLKSFFLDEMQHTRERNSEIFYLNQIDRANKHRALSILETMVVTGLPDIDAGAIQFKNNWIVFPPGVAHRVSLPREGVARLSEIRTELETWFGPEEVFAGQPVIGTLVALHDSVSDCLIEFQKACARVFPRIVPEKYSG